MLKAYLHSNIAKTNQTIIIVTAYPVQGDQQLEVLLCWFLLVPLPLQPHCRDYWACSLPPCCRG